MFDILEFLFINPKSILKFVDVSDRHSFNNNLTFLACFPEWKPPPRLQRAGPEASPGSSSLMRPTGAELRAVNKQRRHRWMLTLAFPVSRPHRLELNFHNRFQTRTCELVTENLTTHISNRTLSGLLLTSQIKKIY